MYIGEFSKRTGVSQRLIRYYEEKGLLFPDRDRSGYRTYAEEDIQRLSLIRIYLSLGMKTEEAARLLSCESGLPPHPLCLTAYSIYQNQLSSMNQKIKVLLHARNMLKRRLLSYERKNQNDH